MKFKKFGWNGFFLEVPKEMRFTGHGGNAKSGHFTLEAGEYLVEAKWESITRKKSKPLPEVMESFIEQMKKKSKKQTVEVLGKNEAHVSKHDALYLTVRSEVVERLYIWHCDRSERLVILRLVFKTFDEASKKIVKRFLDTLKCHQEESNIWSLLNLRFEAPKSFLLTDTKITVGRAQFTLTESKLAAFTEKERKILVEYFSMANLIYKDTYRDLDKWFQEKYLKDLSKQLKERKINFETAQSRRLRRHKMTIKQGTTTSGFSWRKTATYTNATWYCSGTNRIYSVTGSSSIKRPTFLNRQIDEEDHKKVMEDLLSSFKCH